MAGVIAGEVITATPVISIPVSAGARGHPASAADVATMVAAIIAAITVGITGVTAVLANAKSDSHRPIACPPPVRLHLIKGQPGN